MKKNKIRKSTWLSYGFPMAFPWERRPQRRSVYSSSALVQALGRARQWRPGAPG